MKAVLFDMDGVLLDTYEANISWYHDLLVKNGYREPTRKEIVGVKHIRIYDALQRLSHEKSKAKMMALYKKCQSPESDRFYRYDLVRVPRNAAATLKALGSRYKLGVVTSRTRRDTRMDLKKMGLLKFFDELITADDYKKPKPDPEPIRTALKRLGARNSEAIFIGDAPTDYESAMRARVKFIFYPREATRNSGCPVAHSFKQIEQMIKKLEMPDQ